jgi:hypothetical protein
LGGNAGKRGLKPAKDTHQQPLRPVEPPKLNEREQLVWDELAPLAREARTLVPATVGDLKTLCVLEVEMADVLAERRKEGWSLEGLALAKEYRGLVQRVEAKRRAFRLAPMGKDMTPPEQPKDEWSEFDNTVQ